MPNPKYRELTPKNRFTGLGIRALERDFGTKKDTVYLGTREFPLESYASGYSPATLRSVATQYTTPVFPYNGISKKDSIEYERNFESANRYIRNIAESLVKSELGNKASLDTLKNKEADYFYIKALIDNIFPKLQKSEVDPKYAHILNNYLTEFNMQSEIADYKKNALWANNPTRRRLTAQFNDAMNDISSAAAMGAVASIPLAYTGIPEFLAGTSLGASLLKGGVGLLQSGYDFIAGTPNNDVGESLLYDGVGTLVDASLMGRAGNANLSSIGKTALHQLFQNKAEKVMVDPNSSKEDLNLALGVTALTTGIPAAKFLKDGALLLRRAKANPKAFSRLRGQKSAWDMWGPVFPATANTVGTAQLGNHLYQNNKYAKGGFMDKALPVLSGGLNVFGNAMNMAGIADTSNIESDINLQKNKVATANTNEGLLNEWSSHNNLSPVTYDQVRGNSGGIGGYANGILSGASAGATFGPIGALVGGGIGALGSIIGDSIGRKKALAKQKELNTEIERANNQAYSNFMAKADEIENFNDSNLLKNFFRKGGYLI